MRSHLLRVCATVSAWDPSVPPLLLSAGGLGGGPDTVMAGSVPGAQRPPPRAVEE